LEFEARRRELRLKEHEAGQAQGEDRGIVPADPQVSNDPIGELGASLTPRPRFDRKANHRRYMREWRRKQAALRKP
jgi:hypothetical protein